MPGGTSAYCITWKFDRAVAALPVSGSTDESLNALVGKADAIGIDAPLDWPEEFAKAVTPWTAAEWNEDLRDRLRFRKTDLYVQEPPLDLSPLRLGTIASSSSKKIMHGTCFRASAKSSAIFPCMPCT